MGSCSQALSAKVVPVDQFFSLLKKYPNFAVRFGQ